ncbi:MAG TPA: hypothetical protein ENH62_10630 [Marinobacter sp.]|uniref:Uncharacterized protein n=1 Tax=marine sediment metagenome TaxID=412755 RepID=A0A0F9KSN4_9ZZZZ|nr:hypothetical protein [Marinobacter sp.]
MTISRGEHNDNNRLRFGPPPAPLGETDSGAAFGSIPGDMVKHLKAFNVQCAHYSTQSIYVTNLLIAQLDRVKKDNKFSVKATTFSVVREDFINLIALANIGRQHLLFMEKESAELLIDLHE